MFFLFKKLAKLKGREEGKIRVGEKQHMQEKHPESFYLQEPKGRNQMSWGFGKTFLETLRFKSNKSSFVVSSTAVIQHSKSSFLYFLPAVKIKQVGFFDEPFYHFKKATV